MKKFLIVLFIWILSFLSLTYVESWRETILILENHGDKNFIKKLNNFNNFYKIQINKPNGSNKTIGYKNETFTKIKNGYSYKYTVNLNMNSINQFIGSLNTKGNINFNTGGKIKDFNILLKDKFQIKGEKQGKSDKIMVKFKNINKPEKSVKSKLFDIENFNMDFMLLKTLPYRDLEKNKTYSYDIFMPSFIKKLSGIKKQELEIKKKSHNKYIISNNLSNLNLKSILIFNKNNTIANKKISFIEFDLIQNKQKKNDIIEKINITQKKGQNQSSKNNEAQSSSNNSTQKSNNSSKDSNQNKIQDSNQSNQSPKKREKTEEDLAKDQLNNFDIGKAIKNITQGQEKKKCDLLINK